MSLVVAWLPHIREGGCHTHMYHVRIRKCVVHDQLVVEYTANDDMYMVLCTFLRLWWETAILLHGIRMLYIYTFLV